MNTDPQPDPEACSDESLADISGGQISPDAIPSSHARARPDPVLPPDIDAVFIQPQNR